jgi:outer membrane receptor for ferrienterochelin and colicin
MKMNLIITVQRTDKSGHIYYERSKEIENFFTRDDLSDSVRGFIFDVANQIEKPAAEAVKISEVNDGWYLWQPNEICAIEYLDMPQVIQVIEGMVWATGVTFQVSVAEAKKSGAFVRKIELNQ